MGKMEVSQHSKYNCVFCGKDNVKRQATGSWKCGSCRKVIAGGAYMLNTPPAESVPPAAQRHASTVVEMAARGLRAAPTKTPRAGAGPPRAFPFPVEAPLPHKSASPEMGGARPRANPSV